MKYYLGSTNTASCKNSGFKRLDYPTNNWNWRKISSGNDGVQYGVNEDCYWAFYGPGIKTIKLEILTLDIVSPWQIL